MCCLFILPKVLEIPFECIYLSRAAASLVKMDIQNAEIISLSPEEGSGLFELKMSIFKVWSKQLAQILSRRIVTSFLYLSETKENKNYSEAFTLCKF